MLGWVLKHQLLRDIGESWGHLSKALQAVSCSVAKLVS